MFLLFRIASTNEKSEEARFLNARNARIHCRSFRRLDSYDNLHHNWNMLDLLSDILTRLSLRGTLYFRTSFTAPFGVHVPSYENVARFHYAHRGECLVHVPAADQSVRLAQGDIIVVPHGAEHMLLCRHSDPMDALPLDRVLQESGYKGDGVLIHGGDEDDRDTQLICGHMSYGTAGRPGVGHMLLDLFERFGAIACEQHGRFHLFLNAATGEAKINFGVVDNEYGRHD